MDNKNIVVEIKCDEWRLQSSSKESLRLEVIGIRSMIIYPLTLAQQMEPSWKRRRLRYLAEAREKGKKITLSTGTVIVYNGKLYFDSCWGSDYTRATNTLSIEDLRYLINNISETDPIEASKKVRELLTNSGRKVLQRLAITQCVIECLGELISKINRGELDQTLKTN